MRNPTTDDSGGGGGFRPQTPLATALLSAANIHSGISIGAFQPFADAKALRATADCLDLFDAVRTSETGRDFLFGFAPVDLHERKAQLVAAKDGSRTIGTMHLHRDAADRLTIRAAAVSPHYAGQKICTAMAALGMLHDFVVNGPMEEVYCAIRVMPSGQENEGSKRSFTRLGFTVGTEIGHTVLSGNFRDRHLVEHAEVDPDGRPITRYRRLSAGFEVVPQSWAFLAAWTSMVLPLPLGEQAR